MKILFQRHQTSRRLSALKRDLKESGLMGEMTRNPASRAPAQVPESRHRRDGRDARRRVAGKASDAVRSCSAAEPQRRRTDQLSRETQSRVAASRRLIKKSPEGRLGSVESMIRSSNHAPCGAHDDTWFAGFLGVQDSAKLLLRSEAGRALPLWKSSVTWCQLTRER